MSTTIGFVGLGLMGSAMARRLLEAGYSLNVFNRTKGKAEPLLRSGATWSRSAADAASAGLVFTMLSTTQVLKDVVLGDEGILKGLPKSGIHIDCSTVSPSLTAELAELYKTRGRAFLHCPVLGSSPQAAEGSLLLMAGGDRSALEASRDVLEVLGKKIWIFDTVEQAAHAKIACNSFIAGMIITLAQAMVFSRKTSVDPGVLLEIIGNSALNSPMYQTKAKSIQEGNFAARFYAEFLLKDINLMIEAAGAAGSPVPVAELARGLFERAKELGLGKEDYSSIIKVFEKL
jgi:3-hydroxyisobutyrate dehydrogenase-like beta-hydroxyacid dehydrogenase